MSIELSIFNVFCTDRMLHTVHHKHIDGLNNLERELKILYKLLGMYYEEFDQFNDVSAESLKDYFELKYPKSRDKENIELCINTAYELEINNELILQFLDQLNEKYTATAMVNKLMPVIEGEKYGIVAGVRDDLDNYIDAMHNPPEQMVVPVPCSKGVRELIKQEVHEPGLAWRLPSITNVVGGLRPDHGGVRGRRAPDRTGSIHGPPAAGLLPA